MTNSHGYVLEYPRIRVDHFDQAPVPLPASLLAHRRSIKQASSSEQDAESLPFAPGQTHFDKPLLYLLTHIHTDHLKGLDRPGIRAPIYCSAATKNLLLKYERQKTRIEKDRDGTHTQHIGVVRPYAHLRVTDQHATARAKLSGFQSASLDLLQPLPYNVPTKVQYTPTSSVTLTLIESNHMFGGTMFLIQGANGAVLHTGDMRSEPWWCEALTRNHFLSPYLCWSKHQDATANVHSAEADNWADHIDSLGSTTSTSSLGDSQSQTDSHSHSSCIAPPADKAPAQTTLQSNNLTRGSRKSQLRLRNIYLDTELLLCNQKVPTKQQACLDMVTLMRMYPPTTVFFLNCWTWGYEDMLIVTAKAFGCKIHVDRFKYTMYKAARTEAPFLADIVTQDGSKTRFHACEKRNVCSVVQSLASRYSSTGDPALAKEALAAYSQMDSSSHDLRQRWGPLRSQPEPLLVYVNPGQISADRWPGMLEDTRQRLAAAQRHETGWPEALVVPLERHSTLPELQMFVGLFRPKTVSPNTILDPKGGLDYYLLHHLFGHLLAGDEDRRKLADQGLLMLGDKSWSFYEAQIVRAREQAQAKRRGGGGDAGGGADSTEAVRAASASFNSNENVGESLDAFQLERLSKLRGISFKGLMMQNMAGNLAAMLEIERWRRAAGIEEPPEGLEIALDDSAASTQNKTDEASVSSVDYDADHSQLAETQAPTLHNRMHPDELASAARLSASNEIIHASSPQEPQSIHAPPADPAPQAQDSQSSASQQDPPTELTEDLASRYINVLIHHFDVSFHRTNASYAEMWRSVRSKMPEDAQKVEEHWFRETGVLPPLWSESNEPDAGNERVEHAQQMEVIQGPQSQHVVAETVQQDSEGCIFREILGSFIDMLKPADSRDDDGVGVDPIPFPTTHDQSVALQLILQHFARIGFCGRTSLASESSALHGQSHATSCDPSSTVVNEWKKMAQPLTDLSNLLLTHLDFGLILLKNPSAPESKVKLGMGNALLSLQITEVLLSYRSLNSFIPTNTVRALLEKVIDTVEAAPSDTESQSKGIKKLVGMACGVLKHEELEETVLEPFGARLLALVHGSNSVLRKGIELAMRGESDTGATSSSEHDDGRSGGESILLRLSSIPHEKGRVEEKQNGINLGETGFEQGKGDAAAEEEGEGEGDEESSIEIRPPRIAPVPGPTLTSTSTPIYQPRTESDSSIIISPTTTSPPNPQNDTIESIPQSPPSPSSSSSATQEEDSTQPEQESSHLEALPIKRARTAALPRSSRRPVNQSTSSPGVVGGDGSSGRNTTAGRKRKAEAEARGTDDVVDGRVQGRDGRRSSRRNRG